MGILAITTNQTGQIGQGIRRVKIITTDGLSTFTTAGYLNPASLQGFTIFPTDILDVWYGATSLASPGTYEVFTVSISNGVITTVQWANPGDVLLPVTGGDFAVFNGTTGQIYDAGYLPSNAAKTTVVMANAATVQNHIMVSTDTAGTVGNRTGAALNDGNLQAGRSGVSGAFISFPSAATSGSLALVAVANSGDYANSITNASTGQATTWTLSDPGRASSFVGQSMSGAVSILEKVFVKTINATSAALASSGHVTVMAHPSATSQFSILDIKVMYSASGLSGGGGDRLLRLTDGTINFNNAGITAALLGTPIYTLWGGTGNPLPNAVSTTSTAGADIYLVYTGGTADFNAGSVTIQVTLQQVTA